MEKKINNNLIEKMKQDYNLSSTISKLAISRNFDQNELYSINNYIELNNVFKNNKDFNICSEILINSIINKDKICIIGDYDVDGSVSTSLLINFFNHINHPHFYYIPDREKDGYGVSIDLFKKIINKNPKLIIMVDCGSGSNDAIYYLNKNKIKSIIIDHHEISKPYPVSNGIINPRKNNGYIKYDYLCASSLTFFFIDIVKKKMNSDFKIYKYLMHVLLATVCDVMPLRKINRIIAIKALNEFKIINDSVFFKLFNIGKKKNNISINELGFFIGPILNSGGRIGKSFYATELLSTINKPKIEKISNDLFTLNEKRKKIEEQILNKIDYKKIELKNEKVIILYIPNINEGLIGIISARLKDYFSKPSIVITNSNNILKGSARSIIEFNIGIVIKNALTENIIIKGGGHKMAAGFSLKKDRLTDFKNFINLSYKKINKTNTKNNLFDSKISSSALNKNFYNELKKLEPYGSGNLEPIFLFEKLKILKSKIIKRKHISCFMKSSTGYSIGSIAFNSTNTKIGEYLLNYKKEINVVAQIKENIWNNKNTLQLTIKDIILQSN